MGNINKNSMQNLKPLEETFTLCTFFSIDFNKSSQINCNPSIWIRFYATDDLVWLTSREWNIVLYLKFFKLKLSPWLNQLKKHLNAKYNLGVLAVFFWDTFKIYPQSKSTCNQNPPSQIWEPFNNRGLGVLVIVKNK